VLQLPRTVTYSPETRSIRLFPINEVAKLRQEQVMSAGLLRGCWWGEACCAALHAA
jgi:hypothetical protein